MQYKSVLLIDGENLVFRYQEMLKEGKLPLKDTIHIKNCFVWNSTFLDILEFNDIIRVAYYTTVVGDEDKVTEVKKKYHNLNIIL